MNHERSANTGIRAAVLILNRFLWDRFYSIAGLPVRIKRKTPEANTLPAFSV
ncbi:MAG: hypothetical protein [Olavius algarvensis Delta 4 endosymbiont]|nr:MAG: hypothetical protein [Olavius algarvensis Delta 4 endosymbiont]